jgi:hypothetical protein
MSSQQCRCWGAVDGVDHDGGDEVWSPTMKKAKKTPASTSNSNSSGY